jgi:hypothetical protein
MRSVLALGAAFWLAACSPLPVVTVGPDPIDPNSPVRPVGYRPVLVGTTHYEPVEPKPWGAGNRAITPGGKAP